MPALPPIGIHLPHGVPGVDGATLLEWARRADEAGYSSLGVAERLVYDNADAVVTLAAAAGATRRIGLLANIFIAAVRPPAVFAKEIATLSRLAPGRLTVGVAGGARPQDHAAVGARFEDRGRLVDEALDALAGLREPEDPPHSLGPVPDPDLQILVGGASKGAIGRMLRHGHGYIGGGLKPEFTGYEIAAVKAAWKESGRPGEPRIAAGAWFASDERYDEGAAWLDTYLQQGGPPEFVRAPIARGADELRAMIQAYTEVGADEVVLLGCVAEVEELDWLTGVVGDHLTG